MHLSVFGVLYILLTAFFCRKRKWFTYWYVFSNTLFYTSVLTVGNFPIKPYHISTIIMFFVFVRGNIFSRNSFKEKDTSSLFLFLTWIYITFLFSFLLSNINVISSDQDMSDYGNLKAIHVTWGSLSQTVFPLFGIFSFFVVKSYIKSKQDIKDFTRGYVLSFIPLAITVALLFTLRNIIHAPALTQAFFSFINPTYSRNVSGNEWGSIGDIARTFTYVGEASYTAKYYLVMMSLFASLLIYRKNNVVQKSWLFFLNLFLLGLTIILGSTTGYVGFIILAVIIGFLFFRYKHEFSENGVKANSNFIGFSFIFGVLLCIPLILMFYEQISFFANYLLVNHVDKIEGDTGSGVARLNTNLIALDIFIKSPIFGVGYGHNRTNSYFTFLLSNVGIIGFVLMNFFCIYLIIMPLKKLRNMSPDLKTDCLIYVTMFIITYLINFAFSSSVAIAFGWFWTNAAILGSILRWRNLEGMEEPLLSN